MAVMAPAKTPREAIERLNGELVKIIRSPSMKETLWDRQWIDPIGSAPGDFAARYFRESLALRRAIGCDALMELTAEALRRTKERIRER